MHAPGPLLASGRDAEIFEYGPGLVYRRARDGRSIAAEARIMEYVQAKGYPVPAIDAVSDDGTAIVMERIDGVDMVASLGQRPWTAPRCGRVLAELHQQLHELEAPEWLRASPIGGGGDRMVHLDLHPLNVMLSPSGPVVIDWANAARGNPAVDVALCWILVGGAAPPAGPVMSKLVPFVRGKLLKGFLGGLDLAGARAVLRESVTYKATDAHMSESEVAAMWQLVEQAGG